MNLSLHAAAEDIRQARRTPIDILEDCLRQIDRYEPHVRAWVLLDRDGARAEAERLTRELRQGNYRGPLHGIPIGIKDIFDVFDWPTAAGSRLWKQSVARQDATVVRRLREAGAVFIGKTVTTQYASFDPPPTRNPWHPGRTPGGSSSGSAAAVACGMCLGALGSQTGGSITRPASYCGVAGCKPSYGYAPLQGVLPLAPSMDHLGPMAGCVEDVFFLTQSIKSYGWLVGRHPVGRSEPPNLRRPRGLFERMASDEVRAMMDDVCSRLERAGARIDEITLTSSFEEVNARHRVVMAVEAAQYHQERL